MTTTGPVGRGTAIPAEQHGATTGGEIRSRSRVNIGCMHVRSIFTIVCLMIDVVLSSSIIAIVYHTH